MKRRITIIVTKKMEKEKISLEKINLEKKKKKMMKTSLAADGTFGLLRTRSEHL